MSRIRVLQHADVDGLGTLRAWLDNRYAGRWTLHALHRGDALPALDDVHALVALGGPMNVDEHGAYSWLAPEKTLIADAVAGGRHVFGICLGAQLIARALGSTVHPAAHLEIGWAPVELTVAGRRNPLLAACPERFHAFHWHGDTFDLPHGAEHLARTAACQQQAFSVGPRVLGFQFHLEADPDAVDAFLAYAHPAPGPHVQPAREMIEGAGLYAGECRGLLFDILDRWIAAPSA